MGKRKHSQLPPPPSLAAAPLFCFRWWYKGRTKEGNIIKLEGRIVADCDTTACAMVEKIMRAKHPTVRWMHGKEVEGSGVCFGPTVQKLRRPVKQNQTLCCCASQN